MQQVEEQERHAQQHERHGDQAADDVGGHRVTLS
jgi:hypothetical protein